MMKKMSIFSRQTWNFVNVWRARRFRWIFARQTKIPRQTIFHARYFLQCRSKSPEPECTNPCGKIRPTLGQVSAEKWTRLDSVEFGPNFGSQISCWVEENVISPRIDIVAIVTTVCQLTYLQSLHGEYVTGKDRCSGKVNIAWVKLTLPDPSTAKSDVPFHFGICLMNSRQS